MLLGVNCCNYLPGNSWEKILSTCLGMFSFVETKLWVKKEPVKNLFKMDEGPQSDGICQELGMLGSRLEPVLLFYST